MSASRRAREALAIEATYRMSGLTHALQLAAQLATSVQCPLCHGLKYIDSEVALDPNTGYPSAWATPPPGLPLRAGTSTTPMLVEADPDFNGHPALHSPANSRRTCSRQPNPHPWYRPGCPNPKPLFETCPLCAGEGALRPNACARRLAQITAPTPTLTLTASGPIDVLDLSWRGQRELTAPLPKDYGKRPPAGVHARHSPLARYRPAPAQSPNPGRGGKGGMRCWGRGG